MTLWINGDWVTGEGDARTKTNPVGGRCSGLGTTQAPGRLSRPVRLHAARFRRGRNGHSPSAVRWLRNLLRCWRPIKPS